MPLWPGSCAESWCSVLVCVPQTHAKEAYLALISFISWGKFVPLLVSSQELLKSSGLFQAYCSCLLCSGSYYGRITVWRLLPCSPSVIIQNTGHNEFCHAYVWSFFFFRRSYVLHPVYVWWPSYSLKLEIVKKLWVAQWCSLSSYSKPCLRDTHPN